MPIAVEGDPVALEDLRNGELPNTSGECRKASTLIHHSINTLCKCHAHRKTNDSLASNPRRLRPLENYCQGVVLQLTVKAWRITLPA